MAIARLHFKSTWKAHIYDIQIVLIWFHFELPQEQHFDYFTLHHSGILWHSVREEPGVIFLFGLLVLLSDARYITKYNLTVSIFLFVFAFRFHIFRSFSSLFKLRCTVILQNNSCHSEHLDDSFFIFFCLFRFLFLLSIRFKCFRFAESHP